MRPLITKAGPYAAASATGIFSAATPTTGTALTLVTKTVDTVQRRLLVTPVSQTNPGTLLVTGLNAFSDTISETISVPASSSSTILSVLDYKSLISIVPAGGPWTANISIGTSASTTAGSSPWLRLDNYGLSQTKIQIVVSGTINWTVEGSDDDPNVQVPAGMNATTQLIAPSAMTWTAPDSTNLSSKAANAIYELGASSGVTGGVPLWLRLTANSYTGAGQAIMTVVQSGGQVS